MFENDFVWVVEESHPLVSIETLNQAYSVTCIACLSVSMKKRRRIKKSKAPRIIEKEELVLLYKYSLELNLLVIMA